MTTRQNQSDAIASTLPGVGRQGIEGNPLTSDEIAMFEKFEKEGWSSDRRRSHILAICKNGSSLSDGAAAEFIPLDRLKRE